MVEHGRFEGYSPSHHGPAREERSSAPSTRQKWGEEDIKIPVEENNTMQAHIRNFLSACAVARSRRSMSRPAPARRC